MFLDKRTASKRSKRFREWFDHYGLLTVFVAALVPLPVMPLKMFVFCSGALGVSPSRFVAVFLAARIPRYLGLALLGQLTTALVFDHFGWMGLPEHPITLTRLAGVALLGAGVWLITR